jgi:aminoglycoside phosphotransferase
MRPQQERSENFEHLILRLLNPVNTCPFTSDHAYRLTRARARIDAGLVEEDDFDEGREGWTAEQVWEAMQGLLPLAPDPVVTHGDFPLDNLLIWDGEVVGCILKIRMAAFSIAHRIRRTAPGQKPI